MPTIPDYDVADTMHVRGSEQLRALADDLRGSILALLRERAYSTQQLSRELDVPKGTVGHHLKVLETAGLVHVVRTRQVRAVTEKFYGRTAKLFLFEAEDPEDERAIGISILHQAARELEQSPEGTGFGHPKASLTPQDVKRIERRLHKLMDDFLAADSADGEPYALAAAMYKRPDA